MSLFLVKKQVVWIGINTCGFLYVRDERYCLTTAATWKQYFWNQFLLQDMISPCTSPQRRNISFICQKNTLCICKHQLKPGIFKKTDEHVLIYCMRKSRNGDWIQALETRANTTICHRLHSATMLKIMSHRLSKHWQAWNLCKN